MKSTMKREKKRILAVGDPALSETLAGHQRTLAERSAAKDAAAQDGLPSPG